MKQRTCIGMFGATGIFVLSLVGATSVRAQPQLTLRPRAFEVASVKPSSAGDGLRGFRGGCHGVDSKYAPNEMAAPPLGRCVIVDARLSHLINLAYKLQTIGMIKGGADWVARGVERFNIEARAEDPTTATENQLLEMLQNLLVERFELKFHRENVEKPGFALVIGKNGAKLKPANSEEVSTKFGGTSTGKPFPGEPISLTARGWSMSMLASFLSQPQLGPVIDSTGLSGGYDFTLAWDDTSGPTVFTAVNEQLGLRLQPERVQVSFFIIDSARKPTDN